MADLRIPGAAPATVPAVRQTEGARAARQAFFQAALNEVAPSAPTRPVQTQAASRAAPANLPAAGAASPESSRYARPGSLLDIKV
jgi:hypothetical protein